MRPILCLVSDRRRLPGASDDALIACVAAAARAGVELIQIRERDLEGGPLTRLVRGCVDAVAGTRSRVLVNDRLDVARAAGAHARGGDAVPRQVQAVRGCVDAVAGTRSRVLVNDRLDVALAAGAHGLHLPGHGVPAARVRAVVPPGFLIGRSVHHATEAARVAGEGGLDYLVFGTVFATASKEGIAPAGLDGLAAAAAAVSLPVLAIGGVTLEHAPQLARTGAAGVAAIGMFADACAAGIDPLAALVAQWARRW